MIDATPSQHVTLIERLPPKTTPAQALSLLINSAAGAGVLSLPYAFSLAGWAGGFLILCCVAAVESYTLYILTRWAESTGASSYGELVHRSLGPAASIALSLTLLLYLFGSSVAYLVILGDSFTPLLTHFWGEQWWTSRQIAISSIGCVLVFPLCFPQSITSAAGISAVNFVAFIAVIAAIVGRSMQALASQEQPFLGTQAFSPTWLRAVPIAVFSLQCHAQVVAVFNELIDGSGLAIAAAAHHPQQQQNEEGSVDVNGQRRPLVEATQRQLYKSRRQSSHKLKSMTKVVIRAIAITAAGYTLVGIAAYAAFPTSIQSNVLNTFPVNDPLMQVARGVVGILEIASYPVNHFPARAAVKDCVRGIAGWELSGSGFAAVETTIFFLSSLCLALTVHDLGAVFTLVGGTCGSVIILGLPGLLLISYSVQKHGTSRRQLGLVAHDVGKPSSVGTTTPLLEDEEAAGTLHLYNVWQSKLFWGGVALTLACCTLFIFTLISVASQQ